LNPPRLEIVSFKAIQVNNNIDLIDGKNLAILKRKKGEFLK